MSKPQNNKIIISFFSKNFLLHVAIQLAKYLHFSIKWVVAVVRIYNFCRSNFEFCSAKEFSTLFRIYLGAMANESLLFKIPKHMYFYAKLSNRPSSLKSFRWDEKLCGTENRNTLIHHVFKTICKNLI